MIILLIFFLLNYYLIENLILFCFFESCIVKYNKNKIKKNLRGYGNLYLFLICINWLLYIYYIYI